MFNSRTKNLSLHPNEKHFAGFDSRRAVEEQEFVVFDTELTGLNPNSDEIISIGAVKIIKLRIVFDQSLHSHTRTSILSHSESTFIHGITPRQAAVTRQARNW